MRAQRDAYKFNCMAFEDIYKNFLELYKDIDLSLIDNGDFLPKLLNAHEEAVDSLMVARKLELNISSNDFSNDKEICGAYENAFNKYDDLNKIINGANKNAAALAAKKLKADKKKKKKERLYEILTWFFGVATVVGLVLTIVGFAT